MSMQAQLNRAQLLRAWHECQQDRAQFAEVAELIGYQAPEDYGQTKPLQSHTQQDQSAVDNTPKAKTSSSTTVKLDPPEPRPQVSYYCLTQHKRYASEQEASQEQPQIFQAVTALSDEEMANFWAKETNAIHEPIRPHSLVQPKTMTPLIRHSLRQQVGQRLAVKTLVKQVAKQQLLTKLPMEPRVLPAGRVTVIADLNQRVLPFWDDMRQACELIKQKHGKIGLDMRVLAKDEPQNTYYAYQDWQAQNLNPQAWQKIPVQSQVFILSDLGQLTAKHSLIRQQWLRFIKQLNHRGITPIVLAPIAAEKQCPIFQAKTQLLLWQRHGQCKSQRSRGNPAQHQHDVERVLSFLSLSPHIEPDLLRALCELLEQQAGNTGIEAAVYLHPHVQWGYTAIALKAEQREHYQQQFKQQPATLKQAVFELIARHHSSQFGAVWAEAILNAETLMTVDKQLVQQAEQLMLGFTKHFSQTSSHEGMTRFAKRHLSRLQSAQHKNKDYVSALYTVAYREQLQHGQALPELYDTQIANQILRQHRRKQAYVIQQVGENLLVSHAAHAQGQVLARFETTQTTIFVNGELVPSPQTPLLEKKGLKDEDRKLQEVHSLSLGERARVRGFLTLDTGQEQFVIHRLQKPSWASAMQMQDGQLTATLPLAGKDYALQPHYNPDHAQHLTWQPLDDEKTLGFDRYGLFADVVIKGITQRFRYIEPNTFMMGSPEDEKGRYSNEDYHQVTLTQGYWLADTTCTQALWRAVMGKNPSEFNENPQNPVENVSWLDVQQFLNKLNQILPNLKAHLPTEAQWENACRAGTTTPFSFEGEIDLSKVNYSGNWDDSGFGSNALQQTAPVKSYPANPWGVYEMHGNVWEWCLDEWQSNLGTEQVFDPVNASFRSGVKPEQSPANTGSVLENTSIYDSTLLANAEDIALRRVLRGGSGFNNGRYCRSVFRSRNAVGYRYRYFGFRVALGHELPHPNPSPSR